MPKLVVRKYSRNPFNVEAVQLTEDNIKEASIWAKGAINTDEDGKVFIKVKVPKAYDPKQTRAYVGDWILRSGRSMKVFTNAAFVQNFTLIPSEGVQPSQNAKLEEEITKASVKFVETVQNL